MSTVTAEETMQISRKSWMFEEVDFEVDLKIYFKGELPFYEKKKVVLLKSHTFVTWFFSS